MEITTQRYKNNNEQKGILLLLDYVETDLTNNRVVCKAKKINE